jgi:hypothetical protein
MSTCLSSKNGVKARKRKWCAFCGEAINPGDLKDVRNGVDGSDFWTMHMHPECHDYEKQPGVVDDEWYEGSYEIAFTRAEAIEFANKKKLKK